MKKIHKKYKDNVKNNNNNKPSIIAFFEDNYVLVSASFLSNHDVTMVFLVIFVFSKRNKHNRFQSQKNPNHN